MSGAMVQMVWVKRINIYRTGGVERSVTECIETFLGVIYKIGIGRCADFGNSFICLFLCIISVFDYDT